LLRHEAHVRPILREETLTVKMPRAVRSAFVLLAVLVPCTVLAQEIRLEERPRPAVPPGEASVPPRPDVTAPPASGVPARDIRVEHDPAFIEPFVGTTGSGRFGLSGWTAPSTPVGPVFRESGGWFSFGFTLTWDETPSPPTPLNP
jgi:hypothetical protein